MGGKGSKQENHVNPEDFQEMPREEIHEASDEQYMVVRNRTNGILYDRYHVSFLTENDYQYYTESVKFRRNEDNIVRAHFIVPKHKKQFCSTHYAADVYLEHCRARMSDYKDIPYPDNLYCMMAMLNGYQKLSEKVGGFPVSERQVLIDENGEVRVWINTDFCKNHPQEQERYDIRGTHKSWDDEKFEMVDSIMRMVVENSDDNDGPTLKFGDFYEREKVNFNGRVGFQQAKQIIVEYGQYVNMKIPQVFESVLQIFRGDEEPFLQGQNNILPGEGFNENYDQGTNQFNQQHPRYTNGSRQDSNVIGRSSSHQNIGIINKQHHSYPQQPHQLQPQQNSYNPSYIQSSSIPSYIPAISNINQANSSMSNNYQGSVKSPTASPTYHHNTSNFNPPVYLQSSAPIYRNNSTRVISGPPVHNYRPLPSGNSLIKVPPPPLPPHLYHQPGIQFQSPLAQARPQGNPIINLLNIQRPPQNLQQQNLISNQSQSQKYGIEINKIIHHPNKLPIQPQYHKNHQQYNYNIQDSGDLSPLQREQIEKNLILHGSSNIYGINQQKIMQQLNEYQREEGIRIGGGDRANYDENSKVNIQNFNDSNQNQYYRQTENLNNHHGYRDEDGSERQAKILSQGDIQQQIQQQSRRRIQDQRGMILIDKDVDDNSNNNDQGDDDGSAQRYYQMERMRQQRQLHEQRQYNGQNIVGHHQQQENNDQQFGQQDNNHVHQDDNSHQEYINSNNNVNNSNLNHNHNVVYTHQHQSANIRGTSNHNNYDQTQNDHQKMLDSNGSKFSENAQIHTFNHTPHQFISYQQQQKHQHQQHHQQQQHQQRQNAVPNNITINSNRMYNNNISHANSINLTGNNLAQQFAQQRMQIHSSGSFKQGQLFSAPLNYSTSSNLDHEQIRQSIATSRKEFYYTLNKQVQIDPEIAADLYLFTSAGSLAA